ncbi:MAG: NAD/NADP octopine/nopaline dehydrogenase family protein, partial [Candidatus Thorarchaeota archaeon]
MTENITVCGGGNGSHAMAGDLANRGYNVTLFEHTQFRQNIEKVLTTRTIELTDEIEGTVTLDQVTLDAKEAVEDAEVILLPVPTYAQEPFFDLMLPFLREDQRVIATTGNLGSIVLGNNLKERGIKRLLVGETSTLPYIARMIGPGKVRVIKDKKKFHVSAFPAEQNHEFTELVNSMYKNAATPTKDVVETALNNLNPVAHPVGLLLNAGSIEAAQMNESDYYLYREGISPAVAGVIEAVEQERLDVADALD